MINLSLNKVLFVILVFCIALSIYSNCEATIYYIDYVSGLDSNNGTSTSTPWKHSPGDTNATGNAASASLVVGDKVIFKGAVVYTIPSGHISLSWGGNGDANESRIIYDGDSGTYVSRWGSGTDKAIIDGNESATAIFLATANKGYITINNFELRNITTVTESNIISAEITTATYFRITNNYLHDAGASGVVNGSWVLSNWKGRCIAVSSSNWTIDGNTFADCYHIGIYAHDTPSNLAVKNNTFNDKTSWAMGIAETGTSTLSNVSVHDNIFYNVSVFYVPYSDPHTNGIMMFVQGGAGRFDGFSFYNNYFYGDSLSSNTGQITLQVNTAGATANDINIYNNVLANYGASYALNIYATPGVISNLRIYSNSAWSSDTVYSGFMQLTGTTGSFNGVHIKNNSYSGGYIVVTLDGSSSNFINMNIDYNNWKSTRANQKLYAYGAFQTWSQWQALGFDAHGFGDTSNPQYTDITTPPFNLRPQNTSPLINAGQTLGVPYNLDATGMTRLDVIQWDIGAYEVVRPSPPSSLQITK